METVKGYSWEEAREAIKRASYDKDRVELPAILGCFNWRDLNCLEISRNSDARLAIAFNGITDRTTLLVPKNIAKQTKRNIANAKLSPKITVLPYELGTAFPKEVSPKSYDVVYGEWLSHSLVGDPEFIKRMLNASRKYFLLVMPHPKSDDTTIASFGNPNELDRREDTLNNLERVLRREGWKVNIEVRDLPLDFEDEQTARNTYYRLAYNNTLDPRQKKALDSFLSGNKVHNINDRFYILWAEKR